MLDLTLRRSVYTMVPALLSLLSVISLSEAADLGTYCYVCDGATSFSCYNPNYDTHVETCQYGCEISITTEGGSETVVRSCGPWQSRYDDTCTQTSDGAARTSNCRCNTDYCNRREVTPGREVSSTRCYSCSYYGQRGAGEDSCLTIGSGTPTVRCPYGVCRKVQHSSQDAEGVARACVARTDELSLRCDSSTHLGVDQTSCHCDNHLCNHGNPLPAPGLTVLLSLTLGGLLLGI